MSTIHQFVRLVEVGMATAHQGGIIDGYNKWDLRVDLGCRLVFQATSPWTFWFGHIRGENDGADCFI